MYTITAIIATRNPLSGTRVASAAAVLELVETDEVLCTVAPGAVVEAGALLPPDKLLVIVDDKLLSVTLLEPLLVLLAVVELAGPTAELVVGALVVVVAAATVLPEPPAVPHKAFPPSAVDRKSESGQKLL